MKEIKINSIISNSDNETQNINTIAKYDRNNNTIIYKENDLDIKITIFDEKVVIERKNDDYDLVLIFEKFKKNICNYNIKSIGLELEICVYTKILDISNNMIYIEYEIFNDNKNIGNFEYKLIMGSDKNEYKR